MIVYFIIAAVISVGIIFGGMTMLKKSVASSVEADKEAILVEIDAADKHLQELLTHQNSYASKAQLESLTSIIDESKKSLESEKESLKKIEEKLDEAQRTVEEKEGLQQEIKSAKEEDEIKLQELLTNYSNISDESISLEQHLAQSLKNLDVMKEQLTLSPEQRALLEDLSSALESAGSRLRDLLTEYATTNERLETLKGQHEDLEEEYTRLVEQQLGE